MTKSHAALVQEHESGDDSFYLVKPVTIRVESFDDSALKEFSEDFEEALESPQSIIPIVISSYGGSANGLLEMIDICRSSTAKPIATVAMGKAHSAGGFLLSCGWHGYRFASPGVSIMLHGVSGSSWGTVPSLMTSASESARLERLIYKRFEEGCQLPEGWVQSRMAERQFADWFMTPEEALRLGIIDHIATPRLRRRVQSAYEFNW